MKALVTLLLCGLVSVTAAAKPASRPRTVLTADAAVALLGTTYPGVTFSASSTSVQKRRDQPGQELVLGFIDDERAAVLLAVDVSGAPRVLAKSEPTADETDGRLPAASFDPARFRVSPEDVLVGVRIVSQYSSQVSVSTYETLLLFREVDGAFTCVFNELLRTETADPSVKQPLPQVSEKVVVIDSRHRSKGFADLLVRAKGSPEGGVRFQWNGSEYVGPTP